MTSLLHMMENNPNVPNHQPAFVPIFFIAIAQPELGESQQMASGKRLHNYGKSQLLIRKSNIHGQFQ